MFSDFPHQAYCATQQDLPDWYNTAPRRWVAPGWQATSRGSRWLGRKEWKERPSATNRSQL